MADIQDILKGLETSSPRRKRSYTSSDSSSSSDSDNSSSGSSSSSSSDSSSSDHSKQRKKRRRREEHLSDSDALSIHAGETPDKNGSQSSYKNDSQSAAEKKNNESVGKEETSLDLYSNLNLVSTEEKKGEKIDDGWAKIIDKQWSNSKTVDKLKPLMEKYVVPKNCQKLTILDMNEEINKLLSSFQKKNDRRYKGIQKALRTAVCGALTLVDAAVSTTTSPEKLTQQQIYQVGIDIVALLGRVNTDISDIRKKHAVSVLKPEFKCLTTQTKSSNSKLFGENVSKVLKSIDITNKVGGKIKKYNNRSSYQKKESYDRQDRSYNKSQSFLGHGRNSWQQGRKNYHNHRHSSNNNNNRNQKRKN